MREMPQIETERLVIRPYSREDVESAHQLLQSIGWVDAAKTEVEQLAATREYIHWCSLNHRQLAQLGQPPYGDRAVILKASGELIGSCGLVPYVDDFGNFPSFGGRPQGKATAEMGLLWTIGAAHQCYGFATETARALIEYALTSLNLGRIIATTEYDNHASQRVMAKAGMRLERNPFTDPPWQQVLGIVEK